MNIALIEDDREIRDSLIGYFKHDPEINVTISVESIENFFDCYMTDLNVIIADIGLPGISGIEGISMIKQVLPDTEVLMFTIYKDVDKIFAAIKAGATGYLLKSTPNDKLREAVMKTAEGGSVMSPSIARKVLSFFQEPKVEPLNVLSNREKELVQGLVDGLSYKAIAEKLFISVETVRSHIKNIYRKLHVQSKIEVVRKVLNK
ncbi:MAG: DNA-binding response regulator [Calditrichaeota bacterium]|nr:MAG: DNA-binding response regulator [Calditrichota bacterium]MBL1204469.1 DNA-binding response regulator [Calditrichota bacterium]NOG44298.1 response regulator transcription factor [Calditrichota bacterium]